MNYRYDDENTTPLIEGEVSADLTEISDFADKTDEEPEEKNEPRAEEEYYELPASIKARSRVWSALSLACGILAILLCPLYLGGSIIGLVLSAVSVLFALLSRKVLGFFDSLAIAGLICGIFGAVCCIFTIIAGASGVLDAIFNKK